MASALETFKTVLIDPFEVNRDGKVLTYIQYMQLPASQQAGDEADVVDNRFTKKMLEDWLGFAPGDITYNRLDSSNRQNKPDFVVKVDGATAFIVEDKSPDKKLDQAAIAQMRRYTAGTSGYCLWTNGQAITALRFDANGQYQMLVDVRVADVFREQSMPLSQDANFEILWQLFRKQRFTDIVNHIQAISLEYDEWQKQARSLADTQVLQTFIQESRFVLDQLVTAILARLNTVFIELKEAGEDLSRSQQKYANLVSDFTDKLKGGGGVKVNEVLQLEKKLQAYESQLVDLDLSKLAQLKPQMGSSTEKLWADFIQKIKALVFQLRERELARHEARRIQDAYQIWLERYKQMEGESHQENDKAEMARQRAFAEQVSYVFFVRLLLARVLEDKGIMPRRLISDGGFKSWFEFLQTSYLDSLAEIRGEAFLPLVYRRVASFYRHFFQQPIFDWFQPDDSLLALVLYRLNLYNFRDVSNDLLGFTYEAFIERVARNQKGHFLTPPDVVEFMLDRAGYNSRAIIGENLLDMSCGSGSFLVHAARRLRNQIQFAMASSSPLERARTFIEQIQTKLVGLEINPFSCYLAELNLFIQVLDDLALLWNNHEQPNIERFSIYNTNSLEMPLSILQSDYKTIATTAFEDEASALDEAAQVKTRQKTFSFILCNPPYVNRGIVLGAKSYGEHPFYREVVKGDENFYLLFLRLAAHYIAPGGTMCFICPLNLFGDESTMRAREMFNQCDSWNLRSITRFYSRTVLFPGVLQGVCVIRIDQAPTQLTNTIEIRGGFSIREAEQVITHIASTRVINNYPAKTTWSKPWLVNTRPETYDFWESIRQNCPQELADLIREKFTMAKGDVRSTWTKALRVSTTNRQTVPMTKGEKIVDWGSWSPAAHLNPQIAIAPNVENYKSSLWVQKNVQRLTNLTEQETALFLKEVSGLEMIRPIRGTIVKRSASHPVVADETVLVIYTHKQAYEELAYAVFGLITSLPYNFLFSLFSTNAHANFKEIIRLPIPIWSEELEQHLATLTHEMLQAYRELLEHEEKYGGGKDQQIDPQAVLVASGLPTLRLEELVLRGDITLAGPQTYALAGLLKREQLLFAHELNSEARLAITQLIQAQSNLSYAKGGKQILMPNPRAAGLFLAQVESAVQERGRKMAAVSAQQRLLDEVVMDAYGIKQPYWENLINEGVPWARD